MQLSDWTNQKRGNSIWLARQMGITPTLISQWGSGQRPVPSDRCPDIERLTGGQVTCEELKPDVDWGYLRGTAARATQADPDATRFGAASTEEGADRAA